ncbi:ABC transporter permease [Spiractinospora alimapuensis]|uniref:ABC transporter permease n=1 Tax=Spiractinospora alimapuensis TaxID=2820884 RepID=UPI001F3203E7|nr:ABC transporter permease [Spiractinospora alimapuensis]QVQ54527.1 ABC transporter permease [Spiractinospora alimapuensis]
MTHLLRAELFRIRTTRLWLWALLAAVVFGGCFTALFTFVGPENFDPPMPPLSTAEGVRAMLGLGTVTLFVPTLIGTVAVTNEYQHHTISHTYLAVPRRGRVLTAKLLAFSLVGVGYALVATGLILASLYGATVTTGTQLGASFGDVLIVLGANAAAMVAYTLIGAGIGALVRNQIFAVVGVIAYFTLFEVLLLMVPGLNAVYPFLPGGASAALTDFSYLTDTMYVETGVATSLLSPAGGFAVLLAYAVVAGVVATATSLRRDVS